MIRVYVGPMFSEKSWAIIDEYDKRFHKNLILVFKSCKDTRDYGIIKTRPRVKDGTLQPEREIPAILINDVSEILEYLLREVDQGRDITTILIDEGNFLEGDPTIFRDLSLMADMDIIIAGLNQDRNQAPFGIMPQILSLADPNEIYHLPASCNYCNRPASITVFDGEDVNENDQVLVGDSKDGYKAVCPSCYRKREFKKQGQPSSAYGLSLVKKIRKNDYGS